MSLLIKESMQARNELEELLAGTINNPDTMALMKKKLEVWKRLEKSKSK